MKWGRQLYKMMMTASEAHARWDYEMSMNILRDKKRLLILGLMMMPAALTGLAFAVDLPSTIGGSEAYQPSFYSLGIFVGSILVGLCAGLITGCIGAGGGFIITPALMSMNVKGILAVGTDIFHIFAKAIMGAVIHQKLGNISVPLAVAFLVGSGGGVLAGGSINRWFFEQNPVLSDAFISVVYVIVLGFLGFYALYDFLKLRNVAGEVGAHGGESPHGMRAASGRVGLPARIQSSNIPPLITFDKGLVPGGKKVPALFVAISGALVGLVATIMGAGGGFMTFPIFVYVLGVSSFTTVGTDILQIVFTAGFSAISQYAIYGFIFYTLAMGMLLGSLIGIQIGALVTKVVRGIYIRAFYATATLAGFVNRFFAMPEKLKKLEVPLFVGLSEATVKTMNFAGVVIFVVAMGIFVVWVLSKFVGNIRTLRGEIV